ncbi:MAG: PilZ domain-containing protein [Fibrobacter sp.]|nr:PilZ domain-containing protein [Fibrobacter sp.]
MEERRKRPRTNMEVEFEVGNADGWFKAHNSKDLSMSGVQICSNHNFALGSEVKIRLAIKDVHAELKNEEVLAEVKRVSQIKVDQWCIGLEFKQLSSDASIFLYNLIRYHSD